MTEIFQSSLSFDGVRDRVALASMSLDLSRGFTFEAWVRFDAFNNWSRIFEIGNGVRVDRLILCNIERSGRLSFRSAKDGSNDAIVQTAADVLQLGVWAHVAVTIEPNGTCALYKNGEVLRSEVIKLPRPGVVRGENFLGWTHEPGDEPFKGRMEEVRRWDRARTADEIRGDMHRQITVDPRLLYCHSTPEQGRAPGTGARLGEAFAYQPSYPYCLAFNGVEDRVELPSNIVDCSRGFTFEAWVRFDAFNHGSRIFEVSSGLFDERLIFCNVEQTGRLTFRLVKHKIDDGVVATADEVLKLGVWTHVAVTLDPAGQLTIWCDAKAAATRRINLPNAGNERTRNFLGSTRVPGEAQFRGHMAEVRRWSRALTAAELAASRSRRLVGDEPGLICYYRFNEGRGDRLFDHAPAATDAAEIRGARWAAMSRWMIGESTPLPQPLGEIQPWLLDSRGLDRTIAEFNAKIAAEPSAPGWLVERRDRFVAERAARTSSNSGVQVGDGVYVELPEFAVSFAQGLRLHLWARPTRLIDGAVLCEFGAADDKALILVTCDAAGRLTLTWDDIYGRRRSLVSPRMLQVDHWTHVTVGIEENSAWFLRNSALWGASTGTCRSRRRGPSTRSAARGRGRGSSGRSPTSACGTARRSSRTSRRGSCGPWSATRSAWPAGGRWLTSRG